MTTEKRGYVYILANKNNSVLYTGITNDLIRRTYEHKHKLISGFTKKYNVDKLVYYEVFDLVTDAIIRERQIKSGSRRKKVELVEGFNSDWRDLYEDILGEKDRN